MSQPQDEKNRRVLVIDDNQAIHEDFRKILEGSPGESTDDFEAIEAALLGQASPAASETRFEIDSAYQGQEGLALVQQALAEDRPYAVAFVDVRMPPGWDGIETVSHIWKDDPNLEVVICTAYSDYSWEDMTEAFGETDRLLILKKPFDNVEVRQLACALSAKWDLGRQARRTVDDLESAVAERTRELVEQQKELEETHTQLLQAQKLESIGRLAAGIAHEINTPTQFVGDNTRFLQDSVQDLIKTMDQYAGLLDTEAAQQNWDERVAKLKADLEDLDIEFLREEIPKAIEQSLEGVERVAKIVRSMKEFSHPGGDTKQMVDLNKAIDSTITVARNEWKYVSDLVTDFDPGLPLVPCLAGDFNQVILNMIINASHAIGDVVGENTGEKGTITISTRHDDGWAEVRISDTGTGIAEEHRSKVFDHFFTTKEIGKGTGQGLAIAYNVITEKHGGTISLESEVGKGTTFTVRLPIEPETSTKEQASPQEAARTVQ